MDVTVKRVSSVAVPTNERQQKDRTKKAVRRAYPNRSDVAVMVLHQLTDRILKAVAWSLDTVAVQITLMKLVDRILKIVVANIHPTDVVQIIKHRLEAAIMKVVVVSTLLTVAVQIN